MKKIVFFDTEVSNTTNKILDFGAVNSEGASIHTDQMRVFREFLKGNAFFCGHNIVQFDLKYLKEQMGYEYYSFFRGKENVIDTLYWSALLFSEHPYHKLVKDDKLDVEERNNPLSDSKKALSLLSDEVSKFRTLPEALRRIYYGLLSEREEFGGFFRFVGYHADHVQVEEEVRTFFDGKFCANASLNGLILQQPIELAYALSLINTENVHSVTPPWIIKSYPLVTGVMSHLRGTPCRSGCRYCNEKNDAHRGLKEFFGYDEYRDFGGVPLQKLAVKAAIAKKSLLAVFPTGGGKSITFQVPALMAGRNEKGLTVVISPLQSLMQDQVYNLERIGITEAVTINGLLDPIERAESIRRVEDGEAKLLYISPESLRSRSIERMLLGRHVVRFVIDEAHCFSAWGQDFRVDYLYIGEFIRKLCKKKQLQDMIPVSCFTATAKQNVIEDIQNYFKEQLGLELELFSASSARKNLTYRVLPTPEAEKYIGIRRLLDAKKCPTIIYVSRTKRAEELADRLNQDGYDARAYHGKMDKKEKSDNQKAFIEGQVDIMVATSAFGMGVDKKDVGMVIHYDISDSLENYVQEAGRAGRDQSIQAECYVLYDETDLNKHFVLLNQTKISIQEIQQIWKAIKDMTRKRSHFSSSALEIARMAGWDDTVAEIETRVKTAINALEEAKYVKRGDNIPHVYADSMLVRSMAEAERKIQTSSRFTPEEKTAAIRITERLLKDDTRVDYLADHLGLEKKNVIHIIELLREDGILSDAKDLTAYVDDANALQRGLNALNVYEKLEAFLLEKLSENETVLSVKQLNEDAQEAGIKKSSTDRIITILNFWTINKIVKRERSRQSKDLVRLTCLMSKKEIQERLRKKWSAAEFVLNYLDNIKKVGEHAIMFSVKELVEQYNFEYQLLAQTTDSTEMEHALLYLSRIDVLKLEGGFLVTYNALQIERLQMDNKIRYKAEDYKRLKTYYEQKIQMIHIVGEYAEKVTQDYQDALQFVEDYFQMEYSAFLKKYFRGQRGEEIRRNITPKKFEELFGTLSPAQLQIIKDKESPCIVVAAGPGSGKTKILVHKLAALLLMEDVKHEQMLMLTFSRAAATEFKQRLYQLIGNAASFVEIKTFHSYCFELLGRIGNLERSENVVKDAVESITNGDVELSKITKTVVVIDEAQDMDVHEYQLIRALLDRNDDIRIIAVGDDDQNIYGFRGSDSAYMKMLLERDGARMYELVENYRSKENLVEYTNHFVTCIQNRMKTMQIVAKQTDPGKINVIEYTGTQLVVPVVQKMIGDGISVGTCVLTMQNDTALQVAGLLQKKGIDAKLIQEQKKFSVGQIREIRYFNHLLGLSEKHYWIGKEEWENAKKGLQEHFQNSSQYDLCSRIIETFEQSNRKAKFVSDWRLFLQESQLSDFYKEDESQVCVSTMHKSKGHEYDHVVILLDHFSPYTEESKRLLYVAMTRARKTLTLHYSGGYLRRCGQTATVHVSHLTYEYDTQVYPESDFFLLQAGMHDVALSFFYRSYRYVEKLTCGDALLADEKGCMDMKNNRILYFSKNYQERIAKYLQKGYRLERAAVNFMVYWKDEKQDRETLVVLPEVEMVKT
jgi:ATP-dependent DNA helicase RecQ